MSACGPNCASSPALAGQTMVYVTHDQIEAMGLADRIAVMNHAVLQQFDTPDEHLHASGERVRGRFIGAPSMNILAGRDHRRRNRAIDLGSAGRPTGSPRSRPCRRPRGPPRDARCSSVSSGGVSLVEPGTQGAIAAGVVLVGTVGRRRIVHFMTGLSSFLGVFDQDFAPQAGDALRSPSTRAARISSTRRPKCPAVDRRRQAMLDG